MHVTYKASSTHLLGEDENIKMFQNLLNSLKKILKKRKKGMIKIFLYQN